MSQSEDDGNADRRKSVKFSTLPFSIGSSMSRKGKPGGSSLSQLDASEASLCEEHLLSLGARRLYCGSDVRVGSSDPVGGDSFPEVHVTIRYQCVFVLRLPSQFFFLSPIPRHPHHHPAAGEGSEMIVLR